MRSVSPYLHTLDGRLRIKVAEIKGSPAEAREIAARLTALAGVDEASANAVTGNVLVLHDPGVMTTAGILDALRGWGYLRRATSPAAAAGPLGEPWGTIVLRATTELAIQRLLTALL